MAKPSKGGAPAPSHYTDTATRTFETALKALEKSLPEHHEALAKLLESGRIHDVDAIRAVLEGSEP
mgnify:CR=1 FL=1